MASNITKIVADVWKENHYYDDAERESAMGIFWKEGVFLHLFRQLDLEHTVELACGHGRHVRQYVEKCETVTLVDINQENLDFCKVRFKRVPNVEYLLNSGSSFAPLKDASKTAIFSYDAMVHFELHDVDAYLRDAYRVLKTGGKILWHHSNYAANPGGYTYDNPGGRNFMSADIFSHLAVRAGFSVLSQNVVNWSKQNLDCVSLCQKKALPDN